MAIPSSCSPPEESFDDQVDAVMRATQLLVAITAPAMADVDVTLPQFRVLVMASGDPSLNLRSVAAGLGVHPSNATRACDRLVAAGLLDRREDPADRRQIVLTLTEAGRRLLDSVMGRRRVAIGDVLAEIPGDTRAGLAEGLKAFSAAAARLHGVHEPSTGWAP
ncbi:MAG TPA: MarR family winged helix-turn-helix transcriptional regulator [Actinoallomurus sp.]|jgi:DNA-binding MarR family transcriptional regulator|nr:MarR family winged helix-turn-helix transcriptional regulator [Actinoallomurus sp.]